MSQPPEMPPDPMTATKNAMANKAAEMAANRAEAFVWKLIKPYLPATIVANLQKQASKAFWGAVSGCIFTIVFVVICALIVIPLGLYIAYQVMFH